MQTGSTLSPSAGARLRAALEAERPLQIVGAINAYTAMMAAASGFRALYLSGSGVACASYGWPDLGITSLPDVLEDVRRVSAATDRPLLVDADTGWGNAFSVTRTVKEMIRAGAAGIHLEDQATAKRCGHRPNKEIVSAEEMCDRLKAACDGRTDADFVLMARTDAAASEGVDAAIERACRYRDAGADMIFAEALRTLDEYRRFVEAVGVAGAGEHHGVRPDADVHGGGIGRGGGAAGAVSAERVSRDERGGAGGLSDDPPGRYAGRRAAEDADACGAI